MKKELLNKSRQISYLLRHNPENLKMDKQGWVNVGDLLRKVDIQLHELEEIVSTNNKKRFGFNDDKSKIRAHQGHSKDLKLNITYEEIKFPITYYHGTVFENIKSIQKHGLKPRSRAHVHLSSDIQTAINVGGRHGDTVVVLEIDGDKMKHDGLKIYKSENNVILTERVPPEYIKLHT
jgi:putative RNA 2'-phosphotransferase